MSTYDIGDLIVLSVAFAVEGTPTDPTTIVCRVKSPSAVQTLTYGIDSGLIRDDVGAYHVDVSVTTWGTWWYRWEGTGAAEGAEAAMFRVRQSVFG